MAMPDVYDEIFQYAKEYIQANSEYSPYVWKDIPTSIDFPVIIIRQIDDTLWTETLSKTEQKFYLAFEIEIYTKNKLAVANGVSKQVICKELKKLVNDVFDEHYGMRRSFDHQIPNVDTEVFRWNIKYEGKIDENNKIYRR